MRPDLRIGPAPVRREQICVSFEKGGFSNPPDIVVSEDTVREE